jgi:hypothetical protein
LAETKLDDVENAWLLSLSPGDESIRRVVEPDFGAAERKSALLPASLFYLGR